MHDFLAGVRDLLCPPTCSICGKPWAAAERMPWCPPCDGALPRLRQPIAPAPSPNLDGIVAAARYASCVRDALQAFKYPRPNAGIAFLDAAATQTVLQLAREASALAWSRYGVAEGVVPIPLHPKRLRERGFNQANTLARCIARQWGLPLRTRQLSRTRHTKSQTELTRRERHANLAGAFASRPGRGPLWLVDDITTTGSTLEHAAQALKRAGASRVVAICVAQATGD